MISSPYEYDIDGDFFGGSFEDFIHMAGLVVKYRNFYSYPPSVQFGLMLNAKIQVL